MAETVAELVCHASRELHMKLDCGVYAQRIYGAAGFALPAAGADGCVFAGDGDSAAHGADLGRCRGDSDMRKMDDLAAIAEKRLLGAIGAQRRRDRDCRRHADGRARHDELHEVSRDWRESKREGGAGTDQFTQRSGRDGGSFLFLFM